MSNLSRMPSLELAHHLFQQLDEEFSLFFLKKWFLIFEEEPNATAAKQGYLKVLSKINEAQFKRGLNLILDGETDFTFPPDPSELMKFFKNLPYSQPKFDNEPKKDLPPSPLTPEQQAWHEQCLKNNPHYRDEMARAADPLQKMLINASAYYGGMSKIPPNQMKIYEILDKNMERRKDMR